MTRSDQPFIGQPRPMLSCMNSRAWARIPVFIVSTYMTRRQMFMTQKVLRAKPKQGWCHMDFHALRQRRAPRWEPW